jgi:hypothetical protein
MKLRQSRAVLKPTEGVRLEEFEMNKIVIAGAFIAVAIVAAAGIIMYFSPYHSCVRNYRAAYSEAGMDNSNLQAIAVCTRQTSWRT